MKRNFAKLIAFLMSSLLVMFTFSINANADADITLIRITGSSTLSVGNDEVLVNLNEGEPMLGVTYSGGKTYINGANGYWYNVGSGVQIETVASSAYVYYNAGTINTNNGEVKTNRGTINNNAASVTNNYDLIVTNNGNVTTANLGTITTNKGNVNLNYTGGTISTNSNNGRVVTNDGEVTVNNGRVMTNNSYVATNAGRIENNVRGVTTNTATGIIAHNCGYAEVYMNEGHIYQNESIRSIGGSGLVTTEPEPEPEPEIYVAPVSEPERTPNQVYMDNVDDTIDEIKALAAKITSGEVKEAQTIKFSEGDALPSDMLKVLADCPNVNLEFSCVYENEEYRFLIIGGNKDLYKEDIPWAGVRYIQTIFPNLAKEENTK